MVEIVELKGLEKFDGKIVDIKSEEGEYGQQYIIKIEPLDKTLIKKGKTGAFWNYLKVSDNSDEKTLVKDSVLEKYCSAICKVDSEMKKVLEKSTVPEFMVRTKGRSYTFNKEVLGKAFEGHEARTVWTPIKKL